MASSVHKDRQIEWTSACFELDDELELGGLLNFCGLPDSSRFSAEKKKEDQSQQKRNDQEASNLVCR
jgi:hypothetical protein